MRIELIPRHTSQPIQLAGLILYPSSLRTYALSVEWHATVSSMYHALPLRHATVDVPFGKHSTRASGPPCTLRRIVP